MGVLSFRCRSLKSAQSCPIFETVLLCTEPGVLLFRSRSLWSAQDWAILEAVERDSIILIILISEMTLS